MTGAKLLASVRSSLPLTTHPVSRVASMQSFEQSFPRRVVSTALGSALAAVSLAAQCPNGPVFAAPVHSTPSPSFVAGMLAADFDNDGNPDLVYRVFTDLHVRRNDGPAGFAAPVIFTSAAGIRGFALGDWNRDGRPDIAMGIVTPWAGPATTLREVRLQVWRNGGPAGGFVTFNLANDVLLSPPATASAEGRVAGGDFDADGVLDAAVDDGRGTVWVLRGEGTHGVPAGTFAAPVGHALGAISRGDLRACDVNADGATDLALATVGAGQIRMTVLEAQRGPQGQPLGTFGPLHSTPFPTGMLPYAEATWSDLDADGLPDLLTGDQYGVRVFRNLGSFSLAAPVTWLVPGMTGNAHGRAFPGDFDRDGTLDVAVPCAINYIDTPGNLNVLRDPFGIAAWSGHNTGPGYPESGLAVDVDNDGAVDAAIGKGYHALTAMISVCGVVPGIAVVAPNGGESWVAGTQRTIQWTSAAPVATFDVDVSFDEGETWIPVARDVAGSSCSWWAHEPSTNRARVRVMPSGVPLFADESDGFFAVGGPGLASAVPIGNGCGQPTAPSANATVPRLGGMSTLEMLGASATVPAAWWLSLPAAAPLPLSGAPGCFAYVDPALLSLLGLATIESSGRFAVFVPVPANPSLQGLALAAQATAFVAASPLGLQLSNGVALVLGF